MIRCAPRIGTLLGLAAILTAGLPQHIAALDLEPPGGEYRAAQLVRFTGTEGWEYRFLGSEDQRFRPLPDSLLLDAPSGARQTWNVEFRRGGDLRTESWTIDRQAPPPPSLTVDPRDGTVEITAPPDVRIEYRVGNGPLGSTTGTTTLGVGQFGLPARVTARSIDAAGNPSEPVSVDLDQRDFFQSSLQIVSPVEGRFANRQPLVIDGSSLVSAEFSYTLRLPDGTTRSASGNYAGPILLPAGTLDVEVRALGLDGRSHSQRIRFTARTASEEWIPDAPIARLLDLPSGYLYATGDAVPPAGSSEGPRLLNAADVANDRGVGILSARRSGTAEWLRFVLVQQDARSQLRADQLRIREPNASALSPLGERPLAVDAADGAILDYRRNGELLPEELAGGRVGVPAEGDTISLELGWRDLVTGEQISADSRTLDLVRGRPDPPDVALPELGRSFAATLLEATSTGDSTVQLRVIATDDVPQNWIVLEDFSTFVPPLGYRGLLRLEVRALDRAGIPSDAIPLEVLLDNAAPAAPVIRLEPGQAVVEGDAQVWVSIEDLATSLVLAPLGPVDGPIDISSLPAAEAVIAAWTVDEAGNRSETVRSEPLIRDDTLPRLPTLEGLPAPLQSEPVRLRLPGRAAGIRVLYELREGTEAPGPDEGSPAIQDELVIPGRAGEDLQFTLALRAQETGISRRLGPVTRLSFRIDREAPPTPVLESAIPQRSRRPETLVVRPADPAYPVFYEVTENSGSPEIGRLGGVLRFSGRDLQEVTYSVVFFAQDDAGNRSPPLGPITVTIDRVGPAVDVVEPARLGLRDTLQVSASGADRIFVDIEPERRPERWERRVIEGSAGSVILPEQGGPFLVRAQAADELGNIGEASPILRVPPFRASDETAADLPGDRQRGPQIDVVLPQDADAFAQPVQVQLVSSTGEELRYRVSEGGSPESVRPDDPVYSSPIRLEGREGQRVRYWVSARGESGSIASRSVVLDRRAPEEPQIPGLDFTIVEEGGRSFDTGLVGDWDFRATPVAGSGGAEVSRDGQSLRVDPGSSLDVIELEIESRDRFGRTSNPVRAVIAALPPQAAVRVRAGDQRRLGELLGEGSLAVVGAVPLQGSPSGDRQAARLVASDAAVTGTLLISDVEVVVNGELTLQATEALMLRNARIVGAGDLMIRATALYASGVDLSGFSGNVVLAGTGGRLVDLTAQRDRGSLVMRDFADLVVTGLQVQSAAGQNPAVLVDGARIRASDSRIASVSRSDGTALEVRDGEFLGTRILLEGAAGSFVSRALVVDNGSVSLAGSLIRVAGRGTAVGLIAANSDVTLSDTEILSADDGAESVVAISLRDSSLRATGLSVAPAGASDATAVFLRDSDADIRDSSVVLPEATTTRGVAIIGTGTISVSGSEFRSLSPRGSTGPVAISASGGEMRVSIRATGIGEGLTAWRRSIVGTGTVYESRTADELAESTDPVLDVLNVYPTLPDS